MDRAAGWYAVERATLAPSDARSPRSGMRGSGACGESEGEGTEGTGRCREAWSDYIAIELADQGRQIEVAVDAFREAAPQPRQQLGAILENAAAHQNAS